ncbi:hypothetical protein DMW33_26155 [Vibrio parahaemolyticus]|nr:hypothetical protein [Vibrio parahaemolyticus]
MPCLKKHGEDLRKSIWKETRLPVCVGFGSTLTLAKMANHLAKRCEVLTVFASWMIKKKR